MCVIAPSFADIFKNNMFQNGMLPIALLEEQCQELAKEAEQGLELEVDLEKLEIRRMSGKPAFAFEVDSFRRQCLLNGLDDIALTMQRTTQIEEFEARRSQTWPWLDGLGYTEKKIRVASTQGNKLDW